MCPVCHKLTRVLHHLFAVDLMKAENTVTIRNGKIDMFKGTMRLAVDKWGLIQEAGAADWEVKVSAHPAAITPPRSIQYLQPTSARRGVGRFFLERPRTSSSIARSRT